MEIADGSALADRLNLLFDSVYPTERGPFSNQEAAAEIRQRGEDISAVYIWQLRRGIRDNPTKRHLESLADFFQINPGYFFDDTDVRASADRAPRAPVRQPGAKKMALRAALEQTGLSDPGQRVIAQLVDRCLELEGLVGPDVASAA